MLQILHITTHMGGGVGKALSSITTYAQNHDKKYKHKILMLELPQKHKFIEICKKENVEIIFTTDKKLIYQEILKVDIVQLSWWHHPVMAEFLSLFPQIPIRLIIWSHVSGCNYPVLPFDFVELAHKTFFTTSYSYENPFWTEKQKEFAKMNAEIIFGAGNLLKVQKVEPYVHQGFNIGYVGTLNYSKLNPQFARYCAAADLPNAKFIIVGDSDNRQHIEKEAQVFDLKNKFEFTGYLNDISEILGRFDVFGYPLNPLHFGTTENALLEAMAAGIPVVILNQSAEKYIVRHMETGLIADSIEHYGELVKYLHENPNERKRIGENARKFVLNTYAIENTIKKMNDSYEQVMKIPKKVFEFGKVFGKQPHEWFLSCLDADKGIFEDSINIDLEYNQEIIDQIEFKISNCRHILKEKSKSSIYHFSECFPYDEKLLYWKKLIEKC